MREQPELRVVMVPTDSLVPYANNANVHTDLQVEQIANSIQEFGFNDPVAVWTNERGEDELVEGHGRVLAARKLGMDELPVIYLNALSDEQRRAYTHVHNQLTRNSVFDVDILEAEIELLPFDWESLGFDNVEADSGDEAPAASDNGFTYQEQFAVTVMCEDEEDQERVYNRLVSEGYECKVVVV